jgi:hypothetical protein
LVQECKKDNNSNSTKQKNRLTPLPAACRKNPQPAPDVYQALTPPPSCISQLLLPCLLFLYDRVSSTNHGSVSNIIDSLCGSIETRVGYSNNTSTCEHDCNNIFGETAEPAEMKLNLSHRCVRTGRIGHHVAANSTDSWGTS